MRLFCLSCLLCWCTHGAILQSFFGVDLFSIFHCQCLKLYSSSSSGGSSGGNGCESEKGSPSSLQLERTVNDALSTVLREMTAFGRAHAGHACIPEQPGLTSFYLRVLKNFFDLSHLWGQVDLYIYIYIYTYTYRLNVLY
jgi:hypothetical protein